MLQGFGDAFAARGASLNEAIGALNPLFANLRPVSKALADPTTQLVRFFPELADAARIVAPVAVDNAEQFTNGAIAFGAISSDPQALRDTISGGPPALEAGLRSLPVQQPFLADFADFSRLLQPGVRDLRAALPVLNQAVSARQEGPAANGADEPRPPGRDGGAQQPGRRSIDAHEPQPPGRHLQPRPGRRGEDRPLPGGLQLLELLGDLPHLALRAAHAVRIRGARHPALHRRHHRPGRAAQEPDGQLLGRPGRRPLLEQLPRRRERGQVLAAQRPAGRHPAELPQRRDPGSARQPVRAGGHGRPAELPGGTDRLRAGRGADPRPVKDNPTFGVQNVAKAAGVAPLGKTDLFLEQDGTRIFGPGAG